MCREEARSMFDFGFHNYLQHGFPKASTSGIEVSIP